MDKERIDFMRSEPILVVMAAGIGSRFGGIKQLPLALMASALLIIPFSTPTVRAFAG